MTDRPTNGQTTNQRTDTASDLMFPFKGIGCPKNISVSFFGQVKRFYGTMERFLGQPIYPEDLTE